jgi:hypothetical protein
MTIYVPGKLTLRQTYIGVDDPDAADYIAAVEAADEIASPGVGGLETATKVAIHSFVKGCKADGIWSAIKASCILAGAKTLDGALVPLVGTAPTNYNFVAGDYDRETGLQTDGLTKYLDSNRANNADPQNDCHAAIFGEYSGFYGGLLGNGGNTTSIRMIQQSNENEQGFKCNSTVLQKLSASSQGFLGASRNDASFFTARANSSNTVLNDSSATFSTNSLLVFRRGSISSPNARLSFYSIGESLDLALLDARVTDLMSALGAAIP